MSQLLTPSAAPVGTRCLLTTDGRRLAEAIVLEWSPLCRVKLRWPATGAESWHEQGAYDLAEVLPPAVSKPPMATGDGW